MLLLSSNGHWMKACKSRTTCNQIGEIKFFFPSEIRPLPLLSEILRVPEWKECPCQSWQRSWSTGVQKSSSPRERKKRFVTDPQQANTILKKEPQKRVKEEVKHLHWWEMERSRPNLLKTFCSKKKAFLKTTTTTTSCFLSNSEVKPARGLKTIINGWQKLN